MNILIYLPNISKSSGGIFQYSYGIVKTLLEDKTNSYFIYNDYLEFKKLVSAKTNFTILKPIIEKQNKNRLISRLIKRFSKPQKSNFEKLLEQKKIDIIHSPTQQSPNVKTPTIVTMHDVQELHFPEFFSSKEREYRAINHRKSIEKSTKVIVSYEHIKQDLLNFFDVSTNNIKVILLKMDNLWFEKFIEKKNQLNLISDQYILYPAATWQHKNHLSLLKAIKLLKETGKLDFKLICTGAKKDFFHNVIEPFIKENSLQKDVEFRGIVSDEELYNLYNSAKAVVVPTLYEAGSFPLMESILMKVPVICSNTTSLPATIDNDSFVFDPLNYEDIANKTLAITHDELFRELNIQNSKRVENKLKNKNVCNLFLKEYNNIIKEINA